MKRMLNTIFNGIGCLSICIGLILCIGAAGTSDCGGDMAFVMRLGLGGLAIGIIGAFLAWWKI